MPLIEISVLPHPYFTRKGDDIYLEFADLPEGGGAGRQDQSADLERNGHGGGPEMVEYRAGFSGEGRGVQRADGSKGDHTFTLKLMLPQKTRSGAREIRRAVAVCADSPRQSMECDRGDPGIHQPIAS